MEDNSFSQKIFYLLLFFSIIILGVLCKTLSSVMIPVITAILMAFVFKRVPEKLSKFKIPYVISCIIIIVLLVIVIFSLSSLLLSSLSTIISEYPKYESKFMSIYKIIADKFDLQFDEGRSFIDNIWQILQVREAVQKMALFLSSGFMSFGKTLILILLLFSFLLIELTSLSLRFHTAFKKNNTISSISETIINETSHYIFIKFVISLITGVLVFLMTKIVGMDFAIVWGFTAFLMNFIPTFGSIISTVLTTLFALLQFYPHYGKIWIVFIGMILVNFTLGNIIEPRIEGKELGLSPFIILISLSLWGYIWGFVGMIFAVPLTVIIKIICENIDYLNPIATILGYSKSSSSQKKIKRIKKNKTENSETPESTDNLENNKILDSEEK